MDIIIKLHGFVIGKSAIKAITKYCQETFENAKEFINQGSFEEACRAYKHIITYIDKFNESEFSEVVNI